MKKLNISPSIGFYLCGILLCLSTWWMETQSIPLNTFNLNNLGYATLYLYGIVFNLVGFYFSTRDQVTELRKRVKRIEEGDESEDRL